MSPTEGSTGATLPFAPLSLEKGSGDADLCAAVEGADARFHVGVVVAAEDEGDGTRVTVDFPSREVLALRMGTCTTVSFSGGGLREILSVQGKVVLRSEDAVRHRYQFRFPARGVLAPVISRRRAVRVRPRGDRTVHVSLEVFGSDTFHQAALQDISVSGASVLVTRELEEKLFDACRVHLTIRLDEPGDPLDVVGVIRYRKLAGFVVRYGLEFDQDHEGFAAVRPLLHDYVTRRISEELERLKPRG